MAVKKLSFYLADAIIILWRDHLPLGRFLQKTTLNATVNNWGVELNDFNIRFKFIKGVKNTLADISSRLFDLELTELNPPEKDSYECGCAMPKQLPDVYVDSSKHEPALPVDESSLYATNENVKRKESKRDTEIHLSFSNEKLIDWENNDNFCTTISKLFID